MTSEQSGGGVRYNPSGVFPPYAFLPGRDPHPARDPRGHSFEQEEAPAAYLPPADWRENQPYLFGVDLYNHGYLWEAHEAWESIWHPSKHDAQQANHLQGLIQCAAACLKVRMGQPRGLARLMELGTARLMSVNDEANGDYMGLCLPDIVADFRTFALSSPKDAEGRPQLELAL
ncbi:MAG: hypothetical protein ACI8QS_002316 [Planctomycetota bacterium]|jgi:hypothetical protein